MCTGSIQLQYKALCLLLVRSWVSPLFLVTSQLFRASRVISLRPLPDWICLIFESVWGPLCTVFIYTHPKCLNVLCVHQHLSSFIHDIGFYLFTLVFWLGLLIFFFSRTAVQFAFLVCVVIWLHNFCSIRCWVRFIFSSFDGREKKKSFRNLLPTETH